MKTIEQIAETLKAEPNNIQVYGLHFQKMDCIQSREINADAQIAFDAQTGNVARAKSRKVSEGDFVRCKDGSLERVAGIIHRDNVVTCFQPGRNGVNGSFYLHEDTMSFSGSLDSPVTRCLVFNEETISGSVWFFSERYAGASRGVYCEIDVPVWIEEGAS